MLKDHLERLMERPMAIAMPKGFGKRTQMLMAIAMPKHLPRPRREMPMGKGMLTDLDWLTEREMHLVKYWAIAMPKGLNWQMVRQRQREIVTRLRWQTD